ncbi:MAG: FG-GAP-like repeat-containing protein [Proteobacteria bacterium]|nr:FG-GAP-like repeat-containing protein [Pseudomonadota bacterium]
MKKLLYVLFLITFSLSIEQSFAQQSQDEKLIRTLLQQGFSPEQVIGVDSNGVPITCGTFGDGKVESLPSHQQIVAELPEGTRGWECIPGVIRDDGLDTFRLEVDVNGPVSSVALTHNISALLVPPEPLPFELRDDGLGEDRVAGDFVFTSGLFKYNTSYEMPPFYGGDPDSPAGLYITQVGKIIIEESDELTEFLIKPSIGLLHSDIPETEFAVLSQDIVVSPHLINFRSSTKETQRFLRAIGGDLRNLTIQIYQIVPDSIDFFMFFSTNKIELLPRISSENFFAGRHTWVKVDFTGTGLGMFDNTSSYGSDGRLLGLNVLDLHSRGIESRIAMHEIMHQWVSFTNQSLGLTDASGAHYKNRSSAASMVGGFLWIDNGDGTFTLDCTQGANGAHHAPPLDKYMMGLIDGSLVPTLYAFSDTISPVIKCNVEQIVFADEIVTTVIIEDIQGIHGVRSPGPENAKRDFAIAFIAESHERLLNPTELTFYEILAEHYTEPIPPETDDPYLGISNWVSITRFFGEGTTWRSDIPEILQLTGSINGIVTDASTDQAIPGANVTASGGFLDPDGTDENGFYEILNVPEGDGYTVTASAEGYQTAEVTSVSVFASQTTTVDFALEPSLFTEISTSLTGVGGSSVAWGDYDNDGDLDILLAGGVTGGPVSKIYRNDGNGDFTDIQVNLNGVEGGSVAWGDYNNDGDLDILLAGGVTGGVVSKIYRNDGEDTFTDILAALISGGDAAAWGDYDNDGDLDILLTGYVGDVGAENVSKVYRNDDGNFVDITVPLIGVSEGSAAWGDYDSDADLDIFLTGGTDQGEV